MSASFGPFSGLLDEDRADEANDPLAVEALEYIWLDGIGGTVIVQATRGFNAAAIAPPRIPSFGRLVILTVGALSALGFVFELAFFVPLVVRDAVQLVQPATQPALLILFSLLVGILGGTALGVGALLALLAASLIAIRLTFSAGLYTVLIGVAAGIGTLPAAVFFVSPLLALNPTLVSIATVVISGVIVILGLRTRTQNAVG